MSVEDSLLLHPELLSNDQLRSIIRQRHLKLPILEQMPRESLLEICHQYCVPYAQRQYRDSGRGKILNQNRNSTENSPNKTHNPGRSVAINSHSKDRLRAPPDIPAPEIKRFKQSNGVQRTNHVDIKRKLEYIVRPVHIPRELTWHRDRKEERKKERAYA